MRLLVDLQACQGPSAGRGIGYYALALTRALGEHRRDHELVVLLDGAAPVREVLRLRDALAPAIGRDEVALFPATGARQLEATAADESVREATLAALRPDAVLLSSVFELADGSPLTVNEHCSEVPHASVLYDLIPLTDLDHYKFRPHERKAYLRGVERVQRLDLLLSISDHSAAEAARLLQQCPPVRTIHGAAPRLAAPRSPHRRLEPGFGLSVGRDEPRKDVRTAVRAWARLPEAVRRGRPFVVVGPWSAEGRRRLLQEVEREGLPSQDLVFLESADDHELSWLYRNASLFVFPSLSEGLGLPPLEAMQAGTPALLAKSSSLVELVDDDLPYFAPGDVADLCELMVQALDDEAVRQRLVELGHQAAQRFTWERTASAAWDALERLGRPSPVARRRRVAVVEGGGPVERLVDDLSALHDVTRVDPAGRWPRPWRDFDRTVFAGVRGCEDALVKTPGVVVLDQLPADAQELLAPAVGVLGDAAVVSDLLSSGLTANAVAVLDQVGEQVEQLYACDPVEHWASADLVPLDDAVASALLHPRRWTRTSRPPVYGTDVTIYRTTPFLSGIQRTALQLHDVLRAHLRPQAGALVPLHLGETPDGVPHPTIAEDPVTGAAASAVSHVDWVLCLDLNGHVMSAHDELLRARAAGTGLATNVFDLLPYTNPEWWPPGAAQASFVPWLRHAVDVSDVLLVNSRATAVELQRYVDAERPTRTDGFQVHLLRLGSDFPAVSGQDEPPQRETDHFLMVGTVEPRKGHRAVLDAFEELWARGVDVRLTVLGRQGWLVDDVAERMLAVAGREPRFTWLAGATDMTLAELYQRCTAAIVASEGEGFGLPIVEAAVRGCPVLVNDIPVLRELAGPDATYFSAGRPLADVVDRVLADPTNVGPVSRDAVVTWDEVGRRLVGVLQSEVAPIAVWSPSAGWEWRE